VRSIWIQFVCPYRDKLIHWVSVCPWPWVYAMCCTSRGVHSYFLFLWVSEFLNLWLLELLSFMLVSDLFVVRALFSNLFHTASLSTFYSFSFLFDLSVAVAVSGCHAIRRYYRSWWWHCRWRQQIPGMAYKMEQQSTRLFSSIFHLLFHHPFCLRVVLEYCLSDKPLLSRECGSSCFCDLTAPSSPFLLWIGLVAA